MKKKIFGVVALIGPLAACSGANGSQGDCPTIEQLRAYKPPEATRVFAMDSSRIADLSPERRVVIELNQVPKTVWNGFVAVEDRRFWSHEGVDFRGFGRALIKNITSLSVKEGFSTIPMQLARQVFTAELPMSSKLSRKACEVSLAPRIEKAFTKREILKMYINQIYMGDGLYGVEEASRSFFGKPVRSVNVAEAATLVGLVKNPEGYNPRKHPLRTVKRRNVVLDVMTREGVITASEARVAKAQPLRLAPPIEAAGSAPYFIAAIRDELRERFGEDADVRGLRVYTGLDPVAQKAARDALLEQIKKIEAGEYGKWKHPKPDSAKLQPAQGAGSPYLQGMVVALDVRTGEVRALVGGRDFTHSSYDRAVDARRQPGSAFKPFVYAAAIQQGLTLNTRVETTPVSLEGGDAAWRPDDLVPDSVTELSVRDAFALSSNYAAIRIGQLVGPQSVIQMARAAGVTTTIPPYPSIYLGAAEVKPIEFVAAIGAFGNGGKRIRPRFINRVTDARGKVLYQARESGDYTINSGVAYLTLSLMNDVVDRGTAGSVRRRGFWLPAAGKTGTTNDSKDVWFVGMTPDMVAGVWLGFDSPKTITPRASGGQLAAPVWAELMKSTYAKRDQPAPWTPPADLIAVPIDTASGGIAIANCPAENVRIEYFIPGTEPVENCALHQSGAERAIDKVLQGIRKIF
ncbi:MAG TPA: PBP1A family penicillin-binding protein [Longimicrobiales bacterium]